MEYLRRKSGISCKGKPMLMEWIIKTEKKEKSPHHQGFTRNRWRGGDLQTLYHSAI